jgi:hypothetical protein
MHEWAIGLTQLDSASKIATVAIAILAAVISASQWFLAREKLRLDLYDRRFDAYSQAIDFLQLLIDWDSLATTDREETFRAFRRATHKSQFLFASDPAIPKLFHEMFSIGLNIKTFHEEDIPQRNNFGSDWIYTKIQENSGELVSILDLTLELERKLAPFLAFGQKRIEPLPWKLRQRKRSENTP